MRNELPYKHSRLKSVALQCYRAGVIAFLAFVVWYHRTHLKIDDDFPVTLSEITPILPNAARLSDDFARMGLNIYDAKRARIGYAVRTQPDCKDITGYAGPTDAMLVFDANWIVRGVKVRRSRDTLLHFLSVATDRQFVKLWIGKTWDQVAGMDLKKEGVEGVSGATLTSMAVARSFVFRLKSGGSNAKPAAPPPLSIHAADIVLFAALGIALAIAFSRLRGHRFLRGVWQIVLVGVVGLWIGQLLAVALLSGWAVSGIAWRTTPGIALLAAVSLLVPWVSKKALYCQYFCPHGAAQEWIHRVAPRKLRVNLPPGLAAGLRWLPGLLLLAALIVTMLVLPYELADIEPFDAYVLRAWSWTMAVAVIGLAASVFVPMAYCKFGCPTGAILEFIRARGPQDRFGKRDAFALILVAAAIWMFADYERIRAWMM